MEEIKEKSADECKYCNLQKNEFTTLDISSGGRKLVLQKRHDNNYIITDICWNSVYINYCPMCGRKLV